MKPEDFEILRRLAAGQTQRAVAAHYHVVPATIANRMARIRAEAGVSSLGELMALYGRQEGLRLAAAHLLTTKVPNPLGDVEHHINDCIDRDARKLRKMAADLLG